MLRLQKIKFAWREVGFHLTCLMGGAACALLELHHPPFGPRPSIWVKIPYLLFTLPALVWGAAWLVAWSWRAIKGIYYLYPSNWPPENNLLLPYVDWRLRCGHRFMAAPILGTLFHTLYLKHPDGTREEIPIFCTRRLMLLWWKELTELPGFCVMPSPLEVK